MLLSQAATAASSTYDPTLVGMSFVISVFGSLTGRLNAGAIRRQDATEMLSR
jgi:hypothetical protein